MITKRDLELYYKNYVPFLFKKREGMKSGEWIREINNTIDKVKDLDNILKQLGFEEIIIAEVVPRMVTSWKTKWKESRSGGRRPRVKKVTELKDKEAELYILVPKNERAVEIAKQFVEER